MTIGALYIHVPFCVKRCAYCDFATRACNDDTLMDLYVDTLCLQLRRASRAKLLEDVKTVYIGGGTPTYLGTRRLVSLVYLVSLSVNLENLAEFSVEANPESLTDRMVKDLRSLGVNRLSIGAQSFDNAVLKAYGRVHNVATIEHAIDCAKHYEIAFSLDLICGGPGQDINSWEKSVQRAATSGASHISIYPLMLEEGTLLFKQVKARECTIADEDLQADMMLSAEHILEKAGMHRYEVASYAFDGHECKHNKAYWTGVSYLGLGAGASSMFSCKTWQQCLGAGVFSRIAPMPCDSARVRFAASVDSKSFVRAQGHASGQPEFLTKKEAVLEDLMLGCRLSAGIAHRDVDDVVDVLPKLPETIARLVDKGLLKSCNKRFIPTERGWLMGNEIYSAIWGLAQDNGHL